MNMINLFLLSVTIFIFQKTYSQKLSQLTAELNTVLSKKVNPVDPGFAVLVAHKGKTIYKNAFGTANIESKTALNADMVFNAGCLTRQITAIAIMQLVEKGKLSTKDLITKFIPEFNTYGSSITIEHLLTETSGIRDYSKINAVQNTLEQKNVTSLQLISLIAKEQLDFTPGTAWRNSNAGFIILGRIIEKVSGQSYEKYISENILRPTGMKHSFIGGAKIESTNMVKAYYKTANVFANSNTGVAAENAALGINLTLDDYLKFYTELNAGKLINKLSLERTRTPHKLADGREIPYGYATEVTKFEGKTVYNISGYEKGFFASEFYLPHQDIFVLILANSDVDNKKYFAINVFLKAITDINTSLAFKDSKGLRIEYYHFLFDDVVMPKAGIIPPGKKTSVFINGLFPTVHYTTDGTEPTIQSPVYNNKIELTNACTLKIKNISTFNTTDAKSTAYIFKEGKAPEPIENISGLKPGLKYAYYPGNFNLLPDFDKMEPANTGITAVPDLSLALTTDTFAMKFDGYVYIDKDGLYNLYTISDDGSQLYLNEKLIVDSDGSHGNIPAAYVLPLKKGYYALKILYFEKKGHELLQTGYWTDGREPKPFTKEMLFYRD
jgi:CubicO group peptidase (beta-lactamase class C family)